MSQKREEMNQNKIHWSDLLLGVGSWFSLSSFILMKNLLATRFVLNLIIITTIFYSVLIAFLVLIVFVAIKKKWGNKDKLLTGLIAVDMAMVILMNINWTLENSSVFPINAMLFAFTSVVTFLTLMSILTVYKIIFNNRTGMISWPPSRKIEVAYYISFIGSLCSLGVFSLSASFIFGYLWQYEWLMGIFAVITFITFVPSLMLFIFSSSKIKEENSQSGARTPNSVMVKKTKTTS